MSSSSYACSSCGRGVGRESLAVKRVVFQTMGEGARPIRSRVKEWLCKPCVLKDPDYNLPKGRSPGSRPPILQIGERHAS